MYKLLYNIKTGKRYRTKRILVLGPYAQGLAAVTDFGFPASTVAKKDGDPESDPRSTFFCTTIVPKDRGLEAVPADRLAEVMAGREIGPRSGIVAVPAPPPNLKPAVCRHARFGGPIDPARPCLGRKITCRHPDNVDMVRREIECRPPDPAKDYQYNLRSCVLFEPDGNLPVS